MTQGLTMASAVTEGNVPEPCQLKNKTLRALPNVGQSSRLCGTGLLIMSV